MRPHSNPRARSLRRCRASAAVCLIAAVTSGCFQPAPPPAPKPKAEENSGSILKKTTQDIGKYDPAAGREVSDSKIRATNPVTGALEAYGPMVEQISKMQIDGLLLGYQVEHEKWPTYEQFMSDIVKQYNVQLPVLPGKMEYQYDEANHKLVVVYPEGAPKPDTKNPIP